MNDYEYVFKQDARSKKITAQSARKMNRTGKGAVKFPSDYLTKKEKEKLNGPVNTYDMGKPMVWKDFIKLPDDIKRAYLNGLADKYNPTADMIAQMFCVSKTTVDRMRADLKVKSTIKGRTSAADVVKKRKAWDEFLGVAEKEEYVAPVIDVVPIERDEPVEEVHTPVVVTAPAVKEETARERILSRARDCVMGDRDREHGSPENNFTTIANLWNAFLGVKWMRPTDVAAMLALVKVARIASGHGKEDNWVDLAGYAACGGELDELSRSTGK